MNLKHYQELGEGVSLLHAYMVAPDGQDVPALKEWAGWANTHTGADVDLVRRTERVLWDYAHK